MVPIDHWTVATGVPSVRPHPLLAVVATRPLRARYRLEAQRCWNIIQDLRRERPAKAEQHMPLVEIYPRRHMRHGRLDRSNAPTQPTDGTGQTDVRSAQRIGGGLHALRRRCHGDAVLDRGKQARQPRGKEVRQQAECSTALRAIPSSDPQPRGRRPDVTAMTGKRAAARRMQGATGQSRLLPLPIPDVRVDARHCPQRNLQ